jgi:hypothetical protein
MKDKHIVSLLDDKPLTDLSETEISVIRDHTIVCADCRYAFEAAQVSVLLIKERAAETFEPSPFFHTRVLARLRERQAANKTWAWGRMWRAAGALASSMAMTVAALAVLTIALPDNQTSTGIETAAAVNTYSAEDLILNETEGIDTQASDSYVLTTLYGAEEEVTK